MTDESRPGASEFATPPLSTPYATIRRVGPQDTMQLFQLSQMPQVSPRWRMSNTTPSIQQFEQSLWDRVSIQFIIESSDKKHFAGIVQFYGVNTTHGTGEIAAMFHPDYQRRGWPVEGLVLAVNYAFQALPLRKLYGEFPSYNSDQFHTAMASTLAVEGRLVDHEWHWGRFWDVLIVALSRDAFYSGASGRMVERVLARANSFGPPANQAGEAAADPHPEARPTGTPSRDRLSDG